MQDASGGTGGDEGAKISVRSERRRAAPKSKNLVRSWTASCIKTAGFRARPPGPFLRTRKERDERNAPQGCRRFAVPCALHSLRSLADRPSLAWRRERGHPVRAPSGYALLVPVLGVIHGVFKSVPELSCVFWLFHAGQVGLLSPYFQSCQSNNQCACSRHLAVLYALFQWLYYLIRRILGRPKVEISCISGFDRKSIIELADRIPVLFSI